MHLGEEWHRWWGLQRVGSSEVSIVEAGWFGWGRLSPHQSDCPSKHGRHLGVEHGSATLPIGGSRSELVSEIDAPPPLQCCDRHGIHLSPTAHLAVDQGVESHWTNQQTDPALLYRDRLFRIFATALLTGLRNIKGGDVPGATKPISTQPRV